MKTKSEVKNEIELMTTHDQVVDELMSCGLTDDEAEDLLDEENMQDLF